MSDKNKNIEKMISLVNEQQVPLPIDFSRNLHNKLVQASQQTASKPKKTFIQKLIASPQIIATAACALAIGAVFVTGIFNETDILLEFQPPQPQQEVEVYIPNGNVYYPSDGTQYNAYDVQNAETLDGTQNGAGIWSQDEPSNHGNAANENAGTVLPGNFGITAPGNDIADLAPQAPMSNIPPLWLQPDPVGRDVERPIIPIVRQMPLDQSLELPALPARAITAEDLYIPTPDALDADVVAPRPQIPGGFGGFVLSPPPAPGMVSPPAAETAEPVGFAAAAAPLMLENVINVYSLSVIDGALVLAILGEPAGTREITITRAEFERLPQDLMERNFVTTLISDDEIFETMYRIIID